MASSRPAQGNNSIAPLNRPRPAYAADSAPKVTGRGTVSNPAKPPRAALKLDVKDATPKVVTL